MGRESRNKNKPPSVGDITVTAQKPRSTRYGSALLFSDPHPDHRINTRFFTRLFEVLLETTLAGKEEEERKAFDSLLLIANKLATSYLHLRRYRGIEKARLETARKNPLREVVPVSHEPDLYRACDDFLVQVREGLNHVARFPAHCLNNWPLSGMPENLAGSAFSLRSAADGERVPGHAQSFRAIAGFLENNREWIQGAVSQVAQGLQPEVFKVFVGDIDERGPQDYLPMWTDTESVSMVMGNLWDNFFLFAEVVLGSALACRAKPGIGVGFEGKPVGDPESPWRIVKPPPSLIVRPNDLNTVKELMAVQQSDRPMLHTVFQGKRVRIVGDLVVMRPIKETFHEFLWGLLRTTLGEEWWQAERARPADEQHSIYRWFASLVQWKQDTYREENKVGDVWGARPNGDVVALTNLAYDVYTLRHAVQLPKRLIVRLKDRIEFQGAKHEVAVAAIVARAGYKLEFLEGDGKHCEFLATHPSGTRLGVEAKSRRRAGVLHEKGAVDPDAASRGDIQALFDDAKQQKPDGLPFLIFIDVNAPPRTTVSPLDAPWIEDVKACLDTHDATSDGRPDPFNAIVITNFSTHYTGSETARRTGERVLVKGKRPADALPDERLREIWAAVERYGSPPEDVERFEVKPPEAAGA